MLRIGWIDYANCSPLLLQVEPRLHERQIELVHGVPAQLNAELATGGIDLCISSSIEFARHADEYLVLPGHCIGSRGEVQSVLLLTDRPVAELSGQRLLVTAESATSVVLLQILLARHWGLSGIRLEATTLPWQEALQQAPGVLLIGDAALKAVIAGGMPHCYDLGAEWLAVTGLPFVFALWQVNRSAADAKGADLRLIVQLLDQARDRMPERLDDLAQNAPEAAWMGAKRLADYWRHIIYRLDDDHISGLMHYYRLAAELGLLPGVPTLTFLRV